MFNLNITSRICALMKPHISEYSRFNLLISSKASGLCAATASVPGIPSVEYTIGVKELLRSRKRCRYL